MPEDHPASSDDSPLEGDTSVTTIDLTPAGAGPATANPPVVPPATANVPSAGGPTTSGPPPTPTWNVSTAQPRLQLTPYIQEKQQDYVRLTFTVGLLLMFGWVIVWASIESASWPSHWEQTKDMLQIILPALTGLIGSVSGFYFGSRNNTKPS
jgi:hypothetical protein